MGIYIQYIYITKIVVLVSEPVRGRSRATELPCNEICQSYIEGTTFSGGLPPYVSNHLVGVLTA